MDGSEKMGELDERAVRDRLRQILDGTRAADDGELSDLRDLEAPAPLEFALARAGRLESGEHFLAWTPRVPRPLLAHLDERGIAYVLEAASDGSALIHIERR